MTTLPRRDDAGFAVVAVLLALVGLMALAHGALVLAGRERSASVLESRLVERRLASLGSSRLPPSDDTLPTLGFAPMTLASGERGDLRWRTEARALGRELALVSGVGTLFPLPGEERIGTVVWKLDPSARLTAASGVIESGGGVEIDGGSLGADEWLSPSSPESAACAAELHALDSLGARPLAPVAALPPLVGPLPPLGLLPGDSVLERVPRDHHVGGGEIHPAAAVWGGECVDAFANWGSPSAPTGPCGARMALVAADGDLTLRGGEGQGVLVARGSLRLTDGVRFAGVLLVGGDLVVERSSTVVGTVRVGGVARIRSSGRIDGSACAAAAAFRSAFPLRAPYLLPGARIHPI